MGAKKKSPRTITIEPCINCDRDAGRRPYLVARTAVGVFRYRICAGCMERLSPGFTDREAAYRLLTELFVKIAEKTIGRHSQRLGRSMRR